MPQQPQSPQPPLHPAHADALNKVILQLVRGIFLKIAEDMNPEDLDTLLSTDLAHPKFEAILSKHFDGRHKALASRGKTPAAAPAPRHVMSDGRQAPMDGAIQATRQIFTSRKQKGGR